MNIFTCAVAITDPNPGEGHIKDLHAIEYEGAMWIVPKWLDTPDPKVKRPARLISLDGLHYQKMIGNPMGDFVLNQSIPKAVLYGPTPQITSDKYVVRENPEIEIRFHGDPPQSFGEPHAKS